MDKTTYTDTTPADQSIEPATGVEAPEDKNRDTFRPLTFFLLAILGLLMLATYHYPLQRTFESWNSQHGYNANGLFIFIGCCLLLVMIRKRLKKVTKSISYTGLVFVIGALLWTLAFKRGDINAMQTIGFIGLVWALCYYLGGWLLAKAVMFPLFLSLFTVQWGLGSSVVSLKMRIVSTKLACEFINFTGIPFGIQVLRQGTNVSMVDIPDLAFDVAAACSGLQSLVMTSVLCLLMCYLVLKTWWKRLIMVLLIVPIAILNNSLRIVLIAWFGKFFTWIEHLMQLRPGWGKDIAFGAFHEYPGIFVYTMGFVMVWLAAHYLEKLPGMERDAMLKRRDEKKARKEAARLAKTSQASEPAEQVSAPDAAEEQPSDKQPVDYRHYGLIWKHLLIAIALIVVTYVIGKNVKQNIYYTKGIPSSSNVWTMISGGQVLARPLPYITNMPEQVGNRVKIAVPVSQLELKELPADTEYFRGLYVEKEQFLRYQSALGLLLQNASESNMTESVRRQMVFKMFASTAMETNTLDQLINLCAYFRTNVFARDTSRFGRQQMREWQQYVSIQMYMLLVRIAQSDRSQGQIMFAIVQNQSDRHSIHAPEACYPGQGWTIDDPIPMAVTLAGQTIEAARMDVGFKQESIRECVIYWYQCEGQDGQKIYATRNYPWLPFKTALDLIIKGRSDRWAFVRFSTGLGEGEPREDGYVRLQEFISLVEPYLLYPE